MFYPVFFYCSFNLIDDKMKCSLNKSLKWHTERVSLVQRGLPKSYPSNLQHREPACEVLGFRCFEFFNGVQVTKFECDHGEVLIIIAAPRLEWFSFLDDPIDLEKAFP